MSVPRWRELKEQRLTSPDDLLVELGIWEPPVDVHRLCAALGVELRAIREMGWSGAIKSTEDRAICWVDETEHRHRQRFTIAHELGHLFLHPTGLEFRDTGAPTYGHREAEANRFAAELLMPASMLLARTARYGRSPERLARVFQVSEQAMDFRLRNLGLPSATRPEWP